MKAVWKTLVEQSQDSALSAVQTFNNPAIRFKSETFIVMINIAWTYALHAYFRRHKIEYRYFSGEGRSKRFERNPDGTIRYWELRQCLKSANCPLDNETVQNLNFLIGLRDRITHHMSPLLDQFASARYQACSLNLNRFIKEEFGAQFGLDNHLSFSIQFSSISREQLSADGPPNLPASIRSYIAEFDKNLTAEEFSSDRFAYRMLFIPKLVGKPGQADEVVEFLKVNDELTKNINKDYLAFKEVEREKFLPTEIVNLMKEEGFSKFSMQNHTELWQQMDAKNSTKNFGIQLSRHHWFWYQTWVDQVLEHCKTNRHKYE